MTSATDIQLPDPPKCVRFGVILVSVVVGLSALPGMYLATGHLGGFAWGIFGFEALTILAAVFGVLVGLGKFRDGFALALACLAGTILVAAVFGIRVDARPKIGDDPTLQPWINRMLALRMAVVFGYAALASLAVFARDRRCWVSAMRSMACLIPAALIAGGVFRFGLPFGGEAGSSEPNAARVISFLVIAMAVGGLVSVGGHLMIRAFEFGRLENETENAPKDAKTAS